MPILTDIKYSGIRDKIAGLFDKKINAKPTPPRDDPNDSFINHQYNQFATNVLSSGQYRSDRTGVGTISKFGTFTEYDISGGKLPLHLNGRVFTRGIIHELLWFLKGDTNIRYLKENNVDIWDEWIDPKTAVYIDGKLVAGELANIYPKQWVRLEDDKVINITGWNNLDVTIEKNRLVGLGYETKLVCSEEEVFLIAKRYINQIEQVINQIKHDPTSRRIILSAWNVAEIDQMALPPCHMTAQFYVSADQSTIDCIMYQRSADVGLGVRFNIVFYPLLMNMIAHVTGKEVGRFIHVTGDTHIYANQREHMIEMLDREVPVHSKIPRVRFTRKVDSIFDFKYEDFEIYDYEPYPALKPPQVAV